uniref:Putative 8.9 kDa protein n=1 Tax=Ixodes ricinus TaxID=34613 RepID=A0A6B0UG02_IXORI
MKFSSHLFFGLVAVFTAWSLADAYVARAKAENRDGKWEFLSVSAPNNYVKKTAPSSRQSSNSPKPSNTFSLRFDLISCNDDSMFGLNWFIILFRRNTHSD